MNYFFHRLRKGSQQSRREMLVKKLHHGITKDKEPGEKMLGIEYETQIFLNTPKMLKVVEYTN